jgi:hypothetical protein
VQYFTANFLKIDGTGMLLPLLSAVPFLEEATRVSVAGWLLPISLG